MQIERQVLSEHCQLIQKYLPNLVGSSDQTLLQDLANSAQKLQSYISRSLLQILEEILSHAPRIAKDLGKPTPRVELMGQDLAVSQEIENSLRKVAIHLLRNALDHGIESQDERIQAGKNPQGLLSVSVQLASKQLSIYIRDDGRGLAIKKLQELAPQKHAVGSTHAPSLQSLANLIFEAGVTTKTEVNQYSGRGIGMDAIRTYIEEVGGSIEIVLAAAASLDLSYVPFSFKITYPI